MTTTPLDVLIVGCGPVGAVLGNLLGAAGLRVEIVERELDVHHLPRAAHFDGEIMRVFQQLGLADAVLLCTAPVDGMDFVDETGEKIFGIVVAPGTGSSGWSGSYMFYQPELERTLRAGLRRYPNVTLTLGHEVDAVTDRGETVEVTVTDRATGTTATRSARFVVGTDGARSITRAAIGTGLSDYGFDQPWLVVDVVLRRPVELPTAAVQYCDPARPSTFVPQVDPHRRWEFMVMPGDDPEELARPERVAELLAPWITPDDGEVIRAVVYAFHGLVAEHWRRGRVVLAGDSAHQMPPFLGQGMCAGIRDAANLAWKLTRVLRGESPPTLLDTYQSEREPHVRSVIESAIAAGGIIQTVDPDVARLRNEQLRTAPAPPGAPALPPLGPGVHEASGGVPLPQVAGSDGRLGPGFSLVVADPAVRHARLDGIERVEVPELAAWLAARDADCALVRPDRYLVGTARVDSLDTLTGALAAHLYDGSA